MFEHPSAASNGSVQEQPEFRPVKFGSQTDRWGEAEVGVEDVKMWQDYKGEATKLLERFEELYSGLQTAKAVST